MKVLFELLNRDELAIVTRHLSSQPRSRFWDKTLPDLVATLPDNKVTPLLVHSKSPLGNAVGRAFPCVQINGGHKLKGIRISVGNVCHHRLLERVEWNFLEVTVSNLPLESYSSGPVTLYSDLSKHCQGLRVLQIRMDANSAPDLPIQDFLKALRSSLEVLSLSFRYGATATEYRLSKDGRLEELRELNFNGPNLERLIHNMRCDFLLHKNNIDKLSVIAPSIRGLDLLRGVTQESKLAQLRVSAQKCDSLTVANFRIKRGKENYCERRGAGSVL